MAPAKKIEGRPPQNKQTKSACRSRRRNHKHGGHGWLLASIVASTVVKKRDASSFRDAELTAVYQVYRPCVGWKTRNEPRKVSTGVAVCYQNSRDMHRKRGCTFSGRITIAKQTEKVHTFKTVHALLLRRAKGWMHASLCEAKEDSLRY